mmetsp:Transcript_52097/g.124653  ORF Transcript_52097/g.124653 Transcript_52097/m.124653 type:complete len:203 (-) Transcript_52097:324-932(-)
MFRLRSRLPDSVPCPTFRASCPSTRTIDLPSACQRSLPRSWCARWHGGTWPAKQRRWRSRTLCRSWPFRLRWLLCCYLVTLLGCALGSRSGSPHPGPHHLACSAPPSAGSRRSWPLLPAACAPAARHLHVEQSRSPRRACRTPFESAAAGAPCWPCASLAPTPAACSPPWLPFRQLRELGWPPLQNCPHSPPCSALTCLLLA